MKKKSIFVLLVMALVSSTLFASGDSEKKETGKPIVYKISAGVPDSHFEVAALREFESYVEKKTNGSIDVQIFPNNQLGDDKEALALIQQGVIEMCPAGTSALSNFDKSFNLLSSPYLFKSYEDLNSIVSGSWGTKLLNTLDGTGFKGLGYGTIGFTNITNNIRPIITADDVKGLKIRCVQNPVLLDFFNAVGAIPVPMSFGELFSALQQGVVDGQFNPFTTIQSTHLDEVQKYASKTFDIASLVVFVVNEDALNKLSAEQQKAIKEGVKIATAYMNESAIAAESKAEKELIESGSIKINEVSDSTKAELFKRGYSVVEANGKKYNAPLFEELKTELGL